MALGKLGTSRKDKYFLTISGGKVVHSENGKKEYFSYVEGTVESIYTMERVFNGEKVLYWYIDMRGEEGTLYSLSLPYKSGTFKSIILALASEAKIKEAIIRIEPYEKGGYTKVITSSNGKKLDWVTKELPEVETVYISGQPVKNDTLRMDFISSLCTMINQRIEGTEEGFEIGDSLSTKHSEPKDKPRKTRSIKVNI